MSRSKREQTKRSPRKRLSPRQLTALVEEAIVDAYGDSEQRVGFLTRLEEKRACPFITEILGTPVRVERVDLNDAEEIVAICRRGRERQLIPILNLPLPSPPAAAWEWIEAYRHWARGGRYLSFPPIQGGREFSFASHLVHELLVVDSKRPKCSTPLVEPSKRAGTNRMVHCARRSARLQICSEA
jgi:hypothetical protein